MGPPFRRIPDPASPELFGNSLQVIPQTPSCPLKKVHRLAGLQLPPDGQADERDDLLGRHDGVRSEEHPEVLEASQAEPTERPERELSRARSLGPCLQPVALGLPRRVCSPGIGQGGLS